LAIYITPSNCNLAKKQALGGLIINKGSNHMNANWCQEDFLELLVVWILGLKNNREMG
jgi:hypothetical protein